MEIDFVINVLGNKRFAALAIISIPKELKEMAVFRELFPPKRNSNKAICSCRTQLSIVLQIRKIRCVFCVILVQITGRQNCSKRKRKVGAMPNQPANFTLIRRGWPRLGNFTNTTSCTWWVAFSIYCILVVLCSTEAKGGAQEVGKNIFQMFCVLMKMLTGKKIFRL